MKKNAPAPPFGLWPLAATSWLWPLPMADNLERIGSWELPVAQAALLFYRTQDCLAYTAEDIPAVPGLASHAHLPVDLPWQKGPKAVWRILAALMDKAAPLAPWAGVLHPPERAEQLAGVAELWRREAPGWQLLIENIPGQDLKAHWPVIEDFDLPLCLDVGHMLAFDQHWLIGAPDISARVELMHCYAPGLVRGAHEHLPLSRLAPSQEAGLRACLELLRPGAPVLFEVFSEADLRDCLREFERRTADWGMGL